MSAPPTAALARDLQLRALELYQDNPRARSWLHRHLARFDEPLRLAVLGGRSAGKTTLVHALLGETPPSTSDGSAMSWHRAKPALTSLPEFTVIDTPALDEHNMSQSAQASSMDADAVLNLVPNPYRAGNEVLRATHEHPIAASAPVSSLTVVSRADELGSGRVDALISARQLARRYRDEPEVRDLSQDTLAVSGLAASAAATLTEQEFDALATLARSPRAELDAQLLSVDRFTGTDSPLRIDVAMREVLLRRCGLFGLRMATTLIRQGANDAGTLARQLAQRSGVAELREAIRRYFIGHADALKARAALIAVDVVLRREPHRAAAHLLGEVDRVLADAHEYQELRLLGDLDTQRVALPDDLATEAARLIGADGTHPARRLALDVDCPPTDHRYQQALFGTLWRWREHAANPALSSTQRDAATTVIRTCEALATEALTE